MSKEFQYPTAPISHFAEPHDFTGDNLLGIYTKEATQRYVYGVRHITWDGRVFKYFNAGAACYTGRGSIFAGTYSFAGTCSGAVAVGAKEIKFTYAQAGAYFAEDVLAGGFITMYGGTPTDADCPHRMIVGNTLSNANSPVLTLYLEAPLDRIVNDAQFCEVYPNPYADLRYTTGTTGNSFAGLAARYMDTAGEKGWVQTWGPIWVAPHTVTAAMRNVFFQGDGALHCSETHVATLQLAGFVIPPAMDAGPLIMLQISI